MTLIIDGYNVILTCGLLRQENSPLAMNRARIALINRVARSMGSEEAAVVVFDAKHPPPGLPSIFHKRGVTVMFAREHDEADDLIEHLIRVHSVPKKLTVVSSDRRLQTAASRRKATSKTAEAWLDELIATEARIRDADQPPAEPQPTLADRPVDVDKWLDFFQIGEQDLLLEAETDAALLGSSDEDFQAGVSVEFSDLFGRTIDPAELDDLKNVFPQDLLAEIEAELADDEDLI